MGRRLGLGLGLRLGLTTLCLGSGRSLTGGLFALKRLLEGALHLLLFLGQRGLGLLGLLTSLVGLGLLGRDLL